MQPIVMISSWPPRKCGIGTFTEEAVEFIRKHEPERQVHILSHIDGEGENVHPIIDLKNPRWYEPVAERIVEINPYIVHIQHEYGLYNYIDTEGFGDYNAGFLQLLRCLKERGIPAVIEPHTVHGRLREEEENFIREMTSLATVVLFKASYQRWRLAWTFSSKGWAMPKNIMIVPHGARPDRRYSPEQVPDLKRELGLERFVDKRVVGLVGWIQDNKRWDIVTGIWEEMQSRIKAAIGEDWYLLAAGDIRDPHHQDDYERYVADVKLLSGKGLAHFFQFVPRGDIYYKVMAICDFIVLPSLDETQSGTLARVIALNKPYVTTAPLEGLTSQTVESEGGLLFTDQRTLKRAIMRLATDEGQRFLLGGNLYRYLMKVVSWDVVAEQYKSAYRMADAAVRDGEPVHIYAEFTEDSYSPVQSPGAAAF
ncbi:MAG: hypothetical protein IT210_10965 [Armatimonadetes bacterium]|nr:hypothetical protein [Armatimonadota bacterium]